MTNYRRSFIAGASYFFTVNLAGRSSRLLIGHIDWLREAIRYTRARHPFEIDAVAVLLIICMRFGRSLKEIRTTLCGGD